MEVVFIHPDPAGGGWWYLPTQAQVTACEQFLRSRQVTEGDATIGEHPQQFYWEMGQGVEDLGLHWYNGERVTLTYSDQVQVYVPPGLELRCPVCGEAIDFGAWGDGISYLMQTGGEPSVPCGCAAGCLLTQAHDPLGFVISRLTISLERASGRVTNSQFLADLSGVLGVPLTSTSFQL